MALKRINKVFDVKNVKFDALKCHEKLRKNLLPSIRKFSVFLRSFRVCVSECVTEKIEFLDVSRVKLTQFLHTFITFTIHNRLMGSKCGEKP